METVNFNPVNLNYIVAALFILIFALACTKKESYGNPHIMSRLDLDALSLSKSFKGWELYSWSNNSEWNYSLLMGSNKLKDCGEIKENNITVTGTDNLKLLLSKLPEGEYVTWFSKNGSSHCGDCESIILPQPPVQNEIKEFCESKHLHFQINLAEVKRNSL